MTPSEIRTLTNELADVLDRLGAIQDRMLDAIEAKLESMRQSDVEAMTATAHREGEVAAQVSALDQRRCWLAVELCKGLGIQIPPRAQNVSLRSILAKLGPVAGERLAASGAVLREKMLKVAEANRVVELVCREMLAHFKSMFAAMTQAGDWPKTYSHRGAIESRGQVAVLDAVG